MNAIKIKLLNWIGDRLCKAKLAYEVIRGFQQFLETYNTFAYKIISINTRKMKRKHKQYVI